jgi:hypothetical protein
MFIDHHHHHLWHDSPLWAIAYLGFPDNRIFMGWGCQPHAQPPTWRTRPPYLWPPGTEWSSYTHRHWVPILVAIYNTHELCWDYSYPMVTTGRDFYRYWNSKCLMGTLCLFVACLKDTLNVLWDLVEIFYEKLRKEHKMWIWAALSNLDRKHKWVLNFYIVKYLLIK